MEFTEQMREACLQHIRDGVRKGRAAELVGLTRAQFFGYMADHPSFELRVLDAEGEATEIVEEALWQAAASGNASAAKMWLDREDARKKRGRQEPAPAPIESAMAATSDEPKEQRPEGDEPSDDDIQRWINGQ